MSRSTYLPAVIVRCDAQAVQVDRLVRHCRELDGTELIVIENPDKSVADKGSFELNQIAANALHLALTQMKGRPFIWLEADSIPLRSGWRAAISAEYKKVGKPFLLPDMTRCAKEDMASGIGVYPGDSHYLIPKGFPTHGWDAWVEKHLQPVIGRSRLIQHRYGKYFMGDAVPWEFPRDKSILDPDAVIFHKDGAQSLIDCFSPSPYALDFATVTGRKPEAPLFRHAGDIGDVIAALPIFRAMGGGNLLLFHDKDAKPGMAPRESMEGKRFEAIKPLLEAQPYIYSVEWGTGVSTKGFREVLRPRFESLTERQARHIDQWPVDLSPWLTVPGDVQPTDRVICCRSPRYHNQYAFPWKAAAEAYGNRLLFIGLPDEHSAFEGMLGCRVEHAKTENFLEIARIMAGARQVIANQSSPLWVAMGLGKKVIVEGCYHCPNTEIPRPGSYWAYSPEQNEVVRQAFAAVARK